MRLCEHEHVQNSDRLLGNGIHRGREGKTTTREGTPIAPRCHQMGKKGSGERLSRFARSEAIDWRGGPSPKFQSCLPWTTTTTTTSTRDRAQTHAYSRPGRQAQAVLVSLPSLKLRVLEAGHDGQSRTPPFLTASLTRVKPRMRGTTTTQSLPLGPVCLIGHVPPPCAGRAGPCEHVSLPVSINVSDPPANGGGWGETCIAYMALALNGGEGGDGGLRRRQGPGTGRLRAIAVAREAAGGMRGGRVACGLPSGGEGGTGGSETVLLFLLLMDSLVPGFLPPRRPRAGAARVAGRRFVLSAGLGRVLRYDFPALGDRVGVCV